MPYLELICTIPVKEIQIREQLLSILLLHGFNGFIETDDKLIGYIPNESFKEKEFEDEIKKWSWFADKLVLQKKIIADQNWNEEWEKSYDPVVINRQCLVRAPFHRSDKKFPYEIIISPSMTFGTGHHETTYLMLREILTLEIQNKKVLDLGCGTGILSILASLKGAASIVAVDHEKRACENSEENARINNINNIKILMGDSSIVKNDTFDLILSNINLNTLLKELPVYYNILLKHGLLILSGFYNHQMKLLISEGKKNSFILDHSNSKNDWSVLVFRKK